MSFPPRAVVQSYNWSSSRQGQPVVAIVAHGTAGRDSRAYLSRGGSAPDGSDRKVSIHYLISKDGTIWRYVPEERAAHHAGFGTLQLDGRTYSAVDDNPLTPGVNEVTISFELENLQDGRDPYPEAQLLAMGWLINDIRQRHGYALPVVRHGDIDPARRKDPVGLSVAAIEAWTDRAARLTAQSDRLQRYRVRGLPIYQQQSGSGPLAGHLTVDEQVVIDVTYTNGMGHLADGRGFVDLDGLETLP